MTYPSLLSFIWSFMRKQWPSFSIIFAVSLVWSLDATIWPLILQKVIDIFTRYDLNRSAVWTELKFPVLWGLVFWLTVELGFRTQGFLLARSIPRLEASMRMAMFNHIQHHSPRYFNENFSGSLANKITDMTTQVTLILQELLTMIVPALVACVLAIILFTQINPIFAAILGIWLSIHFCICLIFSKKCSQYEHIHGEVRSTLLGKIVDSFTNNFTVNLFYRFSAENSYIEAFQKKEQKTNYQAKKCVEIMRLWLGFFTFLGSGLALNGLMIYFWIHNKISTGEFAQIFYTSWTIGQLIWLVGLTLPSFFQSIGIARQALTIMNDPNDILDPPGAKTLTINRGEIIFDSVSFHYGLKKLFQNKDVHIRGGEKIGLVGYSGAGKSTFVNLILRFFPIKEGKILIDGQDIATVSLSSLRNQIALIPQDPILFHRTLKDNILYGRPDASIDELLEAAKFAHCHEFIEKLPNGYETLVGERGTKLSGGERQRITIARALLANAPILILDEATSSLDSVTERYIQESLKKLMHNRTTIIVAHRLSTLKEVDRLLVFNQGKIIEEGSHQELLERNGHYAHLWRMQAGGFLPQSPEE